MKDKIIELINNELKLSDTKFPGYHSSHEGYAVIDEEFDEVKDEYNKILTVKLDFWFRIKTNDIANQMGDANAMYELTIKLIAESVQLAATCKKYIRDIK